VLLLVVLVVLGTRLLGARADNGSAVIAKEKERAAGFVNRLTVVNMLDVPLLATVTDVDPSQWGRIPPDDEAPAGLQGSDVAPGRVSDVAALRPLRIVDGGGDATFTLMLSTAGPELVASSNGTDPGFRSIVALVPIRSSATEYCLPDGGKCFEDSAWFNWQDAPEPPLDLFRECIEDERVVGSYVNSAGQLREVRAVFQCDATRLQTYLVLQPA